MAKSKEIEVEEIDVEASDVEEAVAEMTDADDPRDEEKPRGRTSMWTMALIVLNLLAMAGFAFLLYTDMKTRLEWSRAVFLRDLAMVGLPVDEKDSRSNADAGLQPRHDLDPQSIKQAYKDRGGPAAEKFLPASENFKADIRFADLDENLVAAYFREANAGKPVLTLQAEMKKIKQEFLNELERKAAEVADKVKGKTPAEKRALAKKMLFPICMDGAQVMIVNERIFDETKTPDNKLNELLVEAAQRRMLFDILQALEIFRPTEKVDPPDPDKVTDPKFKMLLVDRAAELDKVKVDDLKQHFLKRCDDMMAARDWIYGTIERPNSEKRRGVAFLMVTLSQVEIPGAEHQPAAEPKKDADGKGAKAAAPERPLAFPEFKRRAEAVCGLNAFNLACQDLTFATEILEELTVEAVRRDIGTFRHPLTTRIYYPNRFAEQLVAVMKKMDISIPDEAKFQNAVAEHLAKEPGKIESGEMLLKELKTIMAQQNVQIREDPKLPGSQINKSLFESTVEGLLNANAIGFLGKHQAALKRVQDLALLVDVRQRQYEELKQNETAQAKQLQDRVVYEQGMLNDLAKARTRTKDMAEALLALQQELFVAQVNLAGVHEYNLYLAERLKEQERKAKPKSGGGK